MKKSNTKVALNNIGTRRKLNLKKSGFDGGLIQLGITYSPPKASLVPQD